METECGYLKFFSSGLPLYPKIRSCSLVFYEGFKNDPKKINKHPLPQFFTCSTSYPVALTFLVLGSIRQNSLASSSTLHLVATMP